MSVVAKIWLAFLVIQASVLASELELRVPAPPEHAIGLHRATPEAKEYYAAFLQHDSKAQATLREAKQKRERSRQALQESEKWPRDKDNPIVIYSVDGAMYWPMFYGQTMDLPCSVPCRFVKGPDEAALERAHIVLMHFRTAELASNETERLVDAPRRKLAFMTMEPSWGLDLGEGPSLAEALDKVDILITHSQYADIVVNEVHHFKEMHERRAEMEELGISSELPELPQGFLKDHGLLATFITACSEVAKNANASGAAHIVTCLRCKSQLREQLILDLQGLGADIDHQGACHFRGNTRDLPPGIVDDPEGRFGHRNSARKMQLLQAYKFVFSAENIILSDYVTEKFYQAFATQRVPVYLGAPNAAHYAPFGPDSFINALDYTPEQLLALLQHLDNDAQAYQRYLPPWQEVREHFERMRPRMFTARGEDDWMCRTCKHFRKYFDLRT